MDIEMAAVSKISSMIARCPHLKGYIDANDKTPFTDGHIDIYRSREQSKATWRGRVTVQVKGQLGRFNGKYPISTDSLRAHETDGGVLFFVVGINKQSGAGKPYYAALAPFRISAILRDTKPDQKTVTVDFTELRNAPQPIERVVEFAYQAKNQSSSTGFDPGIFDLMKGFTLYTPSELDLTGPLRLSAKDTDFTLVLNTRGGMSVPLNGDFEILPSDYIERTSTSTFTAGGETYLGAKVRRINQDQVLITLAEGLTLELTHSTTIRTLDASLTLQSSFAERMKAIEFYVALFDTSEIIIDGKTLSIEGSRETALGKMDFLRDQLQTLRQLRDLFNAMGVDGRLIAVGDLSERKLAELQKLHRLIVLGEEQIDDSGAVNRILVKLGEWSLMLLRVAGSVEGRWRVLDAFDPNYPHMFRWSPDGHSPKEAIPITVYETVEEEILPTILNLHLDKIVQSYAAIADARTTTGHANLKALALIRAAESRPQRAEEFLLAAAALNDWLVEQEGPEARNLVNRWQIKYRMGTLDANDRAAIRELKRASVRAGGSDGLEAEIACTLLLGDVEEAEALIAELRDERREVMKTWPIWALRSAPGQLTAAEAI